VFVIVGVVVIALGAVVGAFVWKRRRQAEKNSDGGSGNFTSSMTGFRREVGGEAGVRYPNNVISNSQGVYGQPKIVEPVGREDMGGINERVRNFLLFFFFFF
jgi:hypothetical protein